MANKTPISLLQELMVGKLQPLPIYVEKGFGTEFSCVVRAGGVTAEGFASSKKMAKQESARKALEILQGKPLNLSSVTFSVQSQVLAATNPFKNHIGELNEYATKYGVSYPDYSLHSYELNGAFIICCNFQNNRTQGVGITKKEAKQDAAKNMLEILSTSTSSAVKIEKCKNVYSVDNHDEIIKMYNKLSIQKNELIGSTIKDLIAAPNIKPKSENIEDLKRELHKHGVDFTLKEFQKNPCVMVFIVKDTNFTLMGHGETIEEATRAVLSTAINYKKHGCSFSSVFVARRWKQTATNDPKRADAILPKSPQNPGSFQNQQGITRINTSNTTKSKKLKIQSSTQYKLLIIVM